MSVKQAVCTRLHLQQTLPVKQRYASSSSSLDFLSLSDILISILSFHEENSHFFLLFQCDLLYLKFLDLYCCRCSWPTADWSADYPYPSPPPLNVKPIKSTSKFGTS